MTLDPNKPVQTRDGRKARIVSDKARGGQYKYIAIISQPDGTETTTTFTSEGKLHAYCDASPFDLINVPEKREMWVNVYERGGAVQHNTKEQADRLSRPTRIACVRVEYEVGEGL